MVDLKCIVIDCIVIEKYCYKYKYHQLMFITVARARFSNYTEKDRGLWRNIKVAIDSL